MVHQEVDQALRNVIIIDSNYDESAVLWMNRIVSDNTILLSPRPEISSWLRIPHKKLPTTPELDLKLILSVLYGIPGDDKWIIHNRPGDEETLNMISNTIDMSKTNRMKLLYGLTRHPQKRFKSPPKI